MEGQTLEEPVSRDATEPNHRRILFVGLGRMGTPMVKRLSNAGFDTRGHDVSKDALSAAREHGIAVADSLKEGLAGADLLILMLPDSDAVEEVFDSAAVQSWLGAGAMVVDMSSCDPLRTVQLASRAAQRGACFVDAPVSGGVVGAQEGRLTIMAGGAGADIDRLIPVLKPLGTVKRTGSVGSGHAVKALNNLLSAASLLASSEALLVGERFGVAPEVLLDVVNSSSGRSFSTEFKWPNYVLPQTFNSGFSLSLMVKDAQLALDLARNVGLPTPLAEAVVTQWRRAAEVLPKGADHTEISKFAGLIPPENCDSQHDLAERRRK